MKDQLLSIDSERVGSPFGMAGHVHSELKVASEGNTNVIIRAKHVISLDDGCDYYKRMQFPRLVELVALAAVTLHACK